jgi:nucleoside phosphorylase/ADP-ribose pyrophosphatase YjhB (NUDIX family)
VTDEREWQAPSVLLTVDLVILTLRDASLHVLLVERGVEPYAGMMGLPGGFLRDEAEPIPAAARRELSEETGLNAGALRLEQFGVYGDQGRDPRGRVVSVAYLAIMPRLPDPVAGTDAADARWAPADDVLDGRVRLAFDHQRIVADGVERARRKLEHSVLATAFCGPTFTIPELQQVYEAVWGIRLDARNFYRKIQGTRDFVVPADAPKRASAGRPARLFRAGPGTVLYPPMIRPADPSPQRRKTPMNETTIVILTAMNLEYQAVRAQLSGITAHTHPMGTRFEVGHLNGCRVALALTGKGNQSAAVLTERSVAEFAPAAVIFVGVAGALQPHLGLGDVVVATHVYAYHGATSQDDGITARPRTWELSHRVHQAAAHLERTGDWAGQLPGGPPLPRVHFGPVAAGEIAHYSAVSEARQWLREHYGDAVAVEMEAAGIAQAGHLNDALPTIMVRGISDYADEGKSATDDAGWQPRAAANAAAFATALATVLAAQPDQGRNPSSPSHAGGAGHGGPTNLATGNARVGVQGENVTVHGGIQLGEPHPGSRATSFAAKADRPAIRPNKLRLALNWARGAFRGIADLAAGVAAIMTAVRSVT